MSNIGYVEVYINGSWGAVCGDYTGTDSVYWNTSNAQVACRQMGLPWTGAVPFSGQQYYVNSSGPGTLGTVSFAMSRVLCGGNESALEECSYVSGVPSVNNDCTNKDSGRV